MTTPSATARCARTPGAVAVALLAVLGAAGCGGATTTPATADSAERSGTARATPAASAGAGGPSASGAGGTPAPDSSADASPGAGAEQPPPSGTGAAVEGGQDAAVDVPVAVLREIRVGRHDGFDRLVLEFTGPFGPWWVRPVEEVTEDPTGEPVPLQGSARLAVSVAGATLDNQLQAVDGVPRVVYDGPRRVAAGLPNLREVADAGDFEAVLSLGVGLDHAAGLRAYRLDAPTRLVVDVAH